MEILIIPDDDDNRSQVPIPELLDIDIAVDNPVMIPAENPTREPTDLQLDAAQPEIEPVKITTNDKGK